MNTARIPISPLAAAFAAGCALTALSCSYAVAVRPAPSQEAHAFEAALPAAAAVFVDGEQLWREVQVHGGEEHCGGARYPVDAREALQLSVIGTLEPLVREVVPTAAPLDRTAMEARDLDAVIVVRADTFHLGLTTGSFLRFEAGAELTLSVSAFTGDGLQVREVVFGSAVQNRSGFNCDNGAEVLAAAVEIAIRNAMTELGELIANSPRMRDSLGAAGGR